MVDQQLGAPISVTTYQSGGFTLIEVLVVMAILSVLMTVVALNIKSLNDDAEAAGSIVSGAFVQSRTQALSTTSAVRVTLTNTQALTFETSARCSDTTSWTVLTDINASLPEGVTLTAPGATTLPWRICFTSRGDVSALPPSALKLTDLRARTRTLTFYLTGSIDIQ